MWREPVDSVRRHSGRAGNNGWSGIGYAIVFSILSFAGFEGAATLGEELRNRFAISQWTFWIPALLLQPYVIVAYTEVVGFGLAPRKIWLPPLRRWTTLRSGISQRTSRD